MKKFVLAALGMGLSVGAFGQQTDANDCEMQLIRGDAKQTLKIINECLSHQSQIIKTSDAPCKKDEQKVTLQMGETFVLSNGFETTHNVFTLKAADKTTLIYGTYSDADFGNIKNPAVPSVPTIFTEYIRGDLTSKKTMPYKEYSRQSVCLTY